METVSSRTPPDELRPIAATVQRPVLERAIRLVSQALEWTACVVLAVVFLYLMPG
ncbi:MAG: hypothetical protein H0W48_04675 [Methylibium sp.]|nr:hypothetical protein [Methylibium sp.]MBA3623740.1 hypothetical protein [Methylibium sp.]